MNKTLLLIDAIINLPLGAMLLTYPQRLVEALGVPRMSFAFYPSVLGGVLIGIGLVELENRASTRRR